MKTEKSVIEVRSFFDGTQDAADAFAFLIARKTRKNVTNDMRKDVADDGNLQYNTDTRVIDRLPSGYAGD